MAGKKSVIETGVDKLVRLVREKKRISVKEAAKELGVSNSSVEEWGEFLEEAGLISIQTKFATLYLVEKEMSNKDLVSKLKDAKEEKEEFLRRVDSSLNSLNRDADEIKLIGSEFNKIQDLISNNCSILQKKLDKLDDFRSSRSELDVAERSIEKEYAHKLDVLESDIKLKYKEFDDVVKKIDAELVKVKQGAEHLAGLKASQKELRDKVSDANKLLDKVSSEIAKESAEVDGSLSKIEDSKKKAEKIKSEVESERSDVSDVSKKLKASRKEFESMEKEFKQDLELLNKGNLDKVAAYKESKKIMDRFTKFVSESKDMKSLLVESSKEEEALRKEFLKLAKRVQMMGVIASTPKLKSEIAALEKELSTIESKKSSLGGKMRKLRLFMRSVAK